MNTIANDIKTLMDGWCTIMQAAKREFPHATDEELYQITKGAMNHAMKTGVK